MCHEDMNTAFDNNEDIVVIRYFLAYTNISVDKFTLRSRAWWKRALTKHKDLTSGQQRVIK